MTPAVRLRLLLLAVLCLPACESASTGDLHGVLYFAAGQYLGELRLATGDAVPAAHLGDVQLLRVSALDNDELLLSVWDRRPGRPPFRIERYDVARGGTSMLMEGRSAHYLRDGHLIVFDHGQALLAVTRRNVKNERIRIQAYGYQEAAPFIPLGNDAVLYRAPDGVLHRFDAGTLQSVALPALSEVCPLQGAVWIDDRNSLVCRTRSTAESEPVYRLVSLEGGIGEALALPAGRDFRAVAHLADQQVLILNEVRSRRFDRRLRYPVWGYDLSSGRLYAIHEDQYLGDTGVYRSRRQ